MADKELISSVLSASGSKSYKLVFPATCDVEVVKVVRIALKKMIELSEPDSQGKPEIGVSGKGLAIKFKFSEVVEADELEKFVKAVVVYYEATDAMFNIDI